MQRMLKGFALGAAYAAGYLVLRDASSYQWFLPAGLRLGVFLLADYSFLPYVLLGEWAADIYTGLPYVSKFGYAWFSVRVLLSPLPALVGAIILRIFRTRISIEKTKDMLYFLITSLGVALLKGVLEPVPLSLLPASVPTTLSPLQVVAMVLCGDYLGILFISPLALLMSQMPSLRLPKGGIRGFYGEAICVLAGTVFLVWLVKSSPENWRLAITPTLFIPAGWLTYRHGWRGAAAGSLLANLGSRLSLPITQLPAPNLLETQQYIALILTLMLILGTVIDVLRRTNAILKRRVQRSAEMNTTLRSPLEDKRTI